MVGYDLKTGTEKWTVNNMPAGCVNSPVVANGTLYFAGWSPGASGDKSSQFPSFDSILKDYDKNHDGVLSKAESDEALGGFFDNEDLNHDGKLTRDEYDDLINLLASGKNSVFAIKPGGSGNITNTHMIWKKTRGMGYLPSALVYRGLLLMVKDGASVTALKEKTGKRIYVDGVPATVSYYSTPT